MSAEPIVPPEYCQIWPQIKQQQKRAMVEAKLVYYAAYTILKLESSLLEFPFLYGSELKLTQEEI